MSVTAATQTPTASSTASSAGTAGSGQSALQSLSGNFQNFLQLLMTQMQNQDPTSPMDANQFTSELVQFTSVEQQINTNTSLSQLIQLTQAGQVMQGSSMVGKQVEVTSDSLSLQNGSATIHYTAKSSQPVGIAVYSSTGAKVADATVTSQAGTNTWTWDGKDGSGNQLPDGAYRVVVMGANADGTTAALPFTVSGTATGVQKNGTGLQLALGALDVDFSAVKSVGN